MGKVDSISCRQEGEAYTHTPGNNLRSDPQESAKKSGRKSFTVLVRLFWRTKKPGLVVLQPQLPLTIPSLTMTPMQTSWWFATEVRHHSVIFSFDDFWPATVCHQFSVATLALAPARILLFLLASARSRPLKSNSRSCLLSQCLHLPTFSCHCLLYITPLLSLSNVTHISSIILAAVFYHNGPHLHLSPFSCHCLLYCHTLSTVTCIFVYYSLCYVYVFITNNMIFWL